MKRHLMMALTMSLLASGCGADDEGIVITDARVGKPLTANTAMYFTATNQTDQADRLIAVRTDVANRVELHISSMSDDGVMTMNRQTDFSVDAGADLVLEPGGRHLMLLDVDILEVGDTVTVQVEFDRAGTIEVEAVVVEPGTAGSG